MRLLICGSRDWTDIDAIRRTLSALITSPTPPTIIIHGGCRGADELAGQVAAELGIETLVFPADWDKHGRAAGPIRNKRMIEDGKPDRVIAFTRDLGGSRGTRGMVKLAMAADVPVEVHGEVEQTGPGS